MFGEGGSKFVGQGFGAVAVGGSGAELVEQRFCVGAVKGLSA